MIPNPCTDVVIDIETLSTDVTSGAVIQIGVCFFDAEAEEFQYKSMSARLYNPDGIPDQSTLDWWDTQDKQLLNYLKDPCLYPNVKDTLLATVDLFHDWEPKRVWANSPSFDLSFLRNLFNSADLDTPWTYKQECDVRTLRTLELCDSPSNHEMLSFKPEGTSTELWIQHNGQYDAVYEAYEVHSAVSAIGLSK